MHHVYNYKRMFITDSPVVCGGGRLTEKMRLLCRAQKLMLCERFILRSLEIS